MLSRNRLVLAALLAALAAGPARAADISAGLKKGTPDLKSAGPLAFGPQGILFIGDPQGAAIFAIDTGDKNTNAAAGPIKVPALDGKIASLLGTSEKDILINGLAVNPASGNAYLAVSRGRGPGAAGVIMRVTRDGKIEEMPLKDVSFAKAALPDAAQGRGRQDSITHLAYVNGRVFISGLSNEEFASRLRSIPFPFKEVEKGANVEIYHGSHGKLETNSPVRTFVAYEVKGEPCLLAAYTCTPLVKIPIAQLKPDARVKGVTVAELGNRNRPLDMIVYQKDGKDFILMANNSRGLMKISTENIDKVDPITKRVADKAGLTYETIASAKGIQHLDRLDNGHALVLIQQGNGPMELDTMPLP
jgi:hypothetical protein